MVEIQPPDDNAVVDAEEKVSTPLSEQGWDGKMRVNRAVLANPEALSDPDYSDPDAPPPEQIEADEDLLNEEPADSTDIDLVHCRISSIPALRLERFTNIQRLCLRQNAIQSIQFPEQLGETLEELDLYDNLLSHVKGFDNLKKLTTLDLSFNKIKHIKNVSHLKDLKELYFVSNKISRIENLEGLVNLTMIELAANRIREVENLDHLVYLQELWLARNKITEMKNVEMLTNLRLLDIKSNRLTSISGLNKLANLEEFYVSHNAVEAISPESFAHNPKLRVIDISNNKISHLENIGHLKALEEFWASSNLISDFREVERELKDKDKLETVYFEANPLQFSGPAVYRNKIRLALPQIKQIDASKCFTYWLYYIVLTSGSVRQSMKIELLLVSIYVTFEAKVARASKSVESIAFPAIAVQELDPSFLAHVHLSYMKGQDTLRVFHAIVVFTIQYMFEQSLEYGKPRGTGAGSFDGTSNTNTTSR